MACQAKTACASERSASWSLHHLWWILIAQRGWSAFALVSTVLEIRFRSSCFGATSYLIDADYPIDLSRRSSKNEDGNLPLKKSSCRHTGELCPNLPKSSIPPQKINVDNKARFRYRDSCWFRLIDASICWDSAEADTQFAIFAWFALKKQSLIFFNELLILDKWNYSSVILPSDLSILNKYKTLPLDRRICG